jgi:hypothetical protein
VGSPFSIVLVPRYKLSLCHTPIKPDLLGFPGIGVFASGLRDHVITRFASFGLHQHLFSKFGHQFVLSISVLQLINQFFYLCNRPAFKMNIYHKLKVSYIIRYVIIKHVLVKELLILQVQNDDIKP